MVRAAFGASVMTVPAKSGRVIGDFATSALLAQIPDDLSSRDRLPDVALRVIGNMHEQSGNGCWHLLAADRARLGKFFSGERTHPGCTSFQAFLQFGENFLA